MAISTFKYCSQRDVKDVYPNIDESVNGKNNRHAYGEKHTKSVSCFTGDSHAIQQKDTSEAENSYTA